MKFLYLYRYDPSYAFDGYFHTDMVRHFNKTEHKCFAYGPELHQAYKDVIIKEYNPETTLQELFEQFQFDVVICGTQSRMFFNYRPPLVPPCGKAIKEKCWLPKDFKEWKGYKIVFDEDTHYELDNDWYYYANIDIVFDRHKLNSVKFHSKNKGKIKGFWLPLSVDTELFKPDNRSRINKLCMAASVVHEIYVCRKMLIDKLVKKGLMDNFAEQRKIGENYVDCLKTYVSHGNCSSIYHITPAKMFEIMSSGSVLFTDGYDDYGLKELFDDGTYVTYKPDGSDVIEKARKIIKETGLTKEIGIKARECILKRHSHEIRINELVEILRREL